MSDERSPLAQSHILKVRRTSRLGTKQEHADIVDSLEHHAGAVLACSYAPSPQYRERSLAFTDPILRLSSVGTTVTLELLNQRGANVFFFLCTHLRNTLGVEFSTSARHDALDIEVLPSDGEPDTEEARGRLPSPMSVVNAICEALKDENEPDLGLYGAVGYDMAFFYEPGLGRWNSRSSNHRDLVMYLPDRICIKYPDLDETIIREYGFDLDFPRGAEALAEQLAADAGLGAGKSRKSGSKIGGPPQSPPPAPVSDEQSDEQFIHGVKAAKNAFAQGDLFEVVLSKEWRQSTALGPVSIYNRLAAENPAPYSALMNLGHGEYLIAASPEMYLRVTERQVESRPIAGTVARGADALDDATVTRNLLASDKAESELVMCTDVDRNDKARVCEAGSVHVVEHRTVEKTSRVLHTVEHIVGRLAPQYTAVDAFVSHMWAVTVTGAPKIAAVQFIEQAEATPRRWYAGAFGKFLFNGSMDTAITIRTIELNGTCASVRAGSTLLNKSDAADELKECGLKAAALLSTVVPGSPHYQQNRGRAPRMQPAARTRVDVIDHEDSFSHTLADYFRRLGCQVTTRRAQRGKGIPADQLARSTADFVCLSPGPGSPEEFDMSRTIEHFVSLGVPVLGVCLGAQGIAQHFGGQLGRLSTPAHGEMSSVTRSGDSRLLGALPPRFDVGRYHSLKIVADSLPADLSVTARTDDGVVMAIEHQRHAVFGVQFHPESIMTAQAQSGMTILRTAVSLTIASAASEKEDRR